MRVPKKQLPKRKEQFFVWMLVRIGDPGKKALLGKHVPYIWTKFFEQIHVYYWSQTCTCLYDRSFSNAVLHAQIANDASGLLGACFNIRIVFFIGFIVHHASFSWEHGHNVVPELASIGQTWHGWDRALGTGAEVHVLPGGRLVLGPGVEEIGRIGRSIEREKFMFATGRKVDKSIITLS